MAAESQRATQQWNWFSLNMFIVCLPPLFFFSPREGSPFGFVYLKREGGWKYRMAVIASILDEFDYRRQEEQR